MQRGDCGIQKFFNHLVEEFRGDVIKYAFTGIRTDENSILIFKDEKSYFKKKKHVFFIAYFIPMILRFLLNRKTNYKFGNHKDGRGEKSP